MFRFLRDISGGFSVSFAILSMTIATTIGFAVDYAVFNNQRLTMKQSLEAGVLAAVREAPVQGWDEKTIHAVIDRFVDMNLRDSAFGKTEYVLKVKPIPDQGRIYATLLQNDHGYFFLGNFRKNPQIVVEAEAAIVTSENICVLTLNPKNGSTIKMTGKSTLTGRNCGMFANSTDPKAIEVEKQSTVQASQICTSGGYEARLADVKPQPQVDCPRVPDPLADRQPPSYGVCDYKDTDIKKSRTLYPGVYCGGIKIGGNADIRLAPGVYVIKDGEFSVTGNAKLRGENVGFYVTGQTAKIFFENSTSISLTAPKEGPLAGILFFEDRNSPYGREFEISSKDAEMLLGTIYLPRGYLLVKGKSKFAGAAAWTAIIAQEIKIEIGPNLELHSNYAATDIPVPAGIGGTSGQARLTR